MIKKILWGLLVVIVVCLCALAYVLFQGGLFTKVVIQEKEMGPYVLVYKEHIGPYQNIKTVMDDVYYSLLNKDKITTTKGFGIYYDNPKTVPQEKLRSIGGCVIEPSDYDKISQLRTKYLMKEIAQNKALVCEFPFKNSVSIIIGIMKVYPAMNKYINEKHHPYKEIMEVYDMSGKKIEYVMFLEEQK